MKNLLLGIIAITCIISGCEKQPVKQLKLSDIERACIEMDINYSDYYAPEFARIYRKELMKLEDLSGYECGLFGTYGSHREEMIKIITIGWNMTRATANLTGNFVKMCKNKLEIEFQASLNGDFENYPKCD